ncbi:MAG TPA: YsnF/AvaK domain-containing protein [Chthoniobacterales bacterium]
MKNPNQQTNPGAGSRPDAIPAQATTPTVAGAASAALAKAVDPAAHDAYWQEHHEKQPFVQPGQGYASYQAAYRTGYEGARKHGVDLKREELEPKLAQDYAGLRNRQSVEWEHGKAAALAAYDRGAEEINIILHEERLRVGKREVESGQVHVRKVVHTEQVNVPVELRREDVVIERVPASEVRQGNASDAFADKTVEVVLHADEAVVSKEAHVTGAVRVSKTAEVETRVVTDSVKKEDVEVVREGEIRRGDLGKPGKL